VRGACDPAAVSAPSTRLISGSCTTSWLDWTWGELWLTPDAIVRVARGRGETTAAALRRRQRGGGSTVEETAPPSEATLRERVATGDRSRWIELDDLALAKLRRGRLSSRLSVVLRDGSRAKLLWLKDDPAYDVLLATLSERLGSDLGLR
jgi:hypothetical protein